jgi:hypothetical protein
VGTSAGCSPGHTGHVSGFKTTGIRLCSSAHNSFGVVVVVMVKLRILSPAGERQVSHNPAMPISGDWPVRSRKAACPSWSSSTRKSYRGDGRAVQGPESGHI